MTDKEALEKSLKMWKWLRDEAAQGRVHLKEDWFEKTSDAEVFCDCYICQYVSNNYKGYMECDKCLVQEWRDKSLRDNRPVTCCDEDSSYEVWKRSVNIYLQRKYCGKYCECVKKNILKGAIDMVDLLEKSLKNLEIENYKVENNRLKRENEELRKYKVLYENELKKQSTKELCRRATETAKRWGGGQPL